MLYASSTIGIMACAVALLMIGGEFDLSSGVAVTFSSLAASMLVVITSFITFDALAFRMVAGLLFVLLGIIGAAWRVARIESTRGTRGPRLVDDEYGIRMVGASA